MKINKKTMRIICAVVIALTVVMSLCNVCFALNVNEINPNNGSIKTDGGMAKVGSNIAAIIRNVGIVLAVVILMILGIKYMMGSAEEKAEYKKTMIPYIVGAILIFASTTIVNVVYNIANGFNATK